MVHIQLNRDRVAAAMRRYLADPKHIRGTGYWLNPQHTTWVQVEPENLLISWSKAVLVSSGPVYVDMKLWEMIEEYYE